MSRFTLKQILKPALSPGLEVWEIYSLISSMLCEQKGGGLSKAFVGYLRLLSSYLLISSFNVQQICLRYFAMNSQIFGIR